MPISSGKHSARNNHGASHRALETQRHRLNPGSERSLRKGHGSPLQYSRLENPTGRGVWQAAVHRVGKESGTTEGKCRDVQQPLP